MRSRLRIAENLILKNEWTIESVQIGRTPYKNFEPNFSEFFRIFSEFFRIGYYYILYSRYGGSQTRTNQSIRLELKTGNFSVNSSTILLELSFWEQCTAPI